MKQTTTDGDQEEADQIRNSDGQFAGANEEHPWRDEENLRTLYHQQNLSTFEIADEWDCSQAVIHKWMEKHDIETRSISEGTSLKQSKGGDVGYFLDSAGYPCLSVGYEGEEHRVRIHRLLAIAEYGIDAVEGMSVHHQNGLKFDNRPDNIELLTQGEHVRLHTQEWVGSEPWHDKDRLQTLYIEQEESVEEIAETLGCSRTTVYNWLRRFNLLK